MAPKSLVFLAASAIGAAMVAAQAAPNWRYIPAACANACAVTAQASYLCETQNSGDTTSIYGCFCSSYPSDAASCATCLNNSDAAALGKLLTSTATQCPDAVKSCFFACSFDTCKSSDVACQCSASYLQSIYNCGACNTANGNTKATQLKDFENLQDSCKNQNYAGAMGSFTTKPVPSATGQAAYVPVTLTAEGGGVAATGGASAVGAPAVAASGAAGSTGSAGSAGSAAGAGVVAGAGVAAVASGGSGAAIAGAAAASASAVGAVVGTPPQTILVTLANGAVSTSVKPGSSASPTGAALAASSSKAAASNIAIPATGLLAVVGAFAALL